MPALQNKKEQRLIIKRTDIYILIYLFRDVLELLYCYIWQYCQGRYKGRVLEFQLCCMTGEKGSFSQHLFYIWRLQALERQSFFLSASSPSPLWEFFFWSRALLEAKLKTKFMQLLASSSTSLLTIRLRYYDDTISKAKEVLTSRPLDLKINFFTILW